MDPRDFKSLHTLDLSSTAVTDAGLRELKDCKALQTLYLRETKVTEADFLPPASGFTAYQAPGAAWDVKRLPRFHVLVPPMTTRSEALAAIQAIGEQGEAGGGTGENEPSHFHRLFANYQAFPELSADPGSWQPTRPVAENPNTLVDPRGDHRDGRITDPRALQWAQLFNLRYRVLLNYLAHWGVAGR